MTEEEFRAFHAATRQPLWSYVARATGDAALADEITQESYFRFLRTARDRLRAEERRPYLFRIAANRMRDHYRAHRSRDVELSPDLIGTDGEAQVEAAALSADVADSLSALAPRSRELLWLAYVEGYSHREMAVMTGLKEHSIRPLLYRARKTLARLLARRGYGDPSSTGDA